MDGDLEIRSGVVIPERELRWRFSRTGGPGGQSVNTTDSRVQVTFDLVCSPSIPEPLKQRAIERLTASLTDGCVTVTASESRSQWQNRRSAQQRLVDILRAAMAPPPRPRRPTRPSRAARERRLSGKRIRAQVKQMRRSVGDE